jgi:hypothetical protein
MELRSTCKTYHRAQLSALSAFLSAHPALLSKLPAATHDAFVRVCAGASRLRSRKTTDFFIDTLRSFDELRGNPLQRAIIRGALWMSSLNWMLVPPYFRSVRWLPQVQETLAEWTYFTLAMAEWDVETAMAFMDKTPKALEIFGPGQLFEWGGQAIGALQRGHQMSRAAKAYLEEAAADNCATPLHHWTFFLDQACRIAEMSPVAAESFIRLGSRVCMLLNDEELRDWVTEGLTRCATEEAFIGYFSGTFLGALAKRDQLASYITLEMYANTLSLICEAFLGYPVKIRPNTALLGVRGFTGSAATDGRTIYLPETAESFESLKLMSLHQATLLDSEEWQEKRTRKRLDPIRVHLQADRRLAEKMPALASRMHRFAPIELPPTYPENTPLDLRRVMPWWGDLLPDLVSETEATLQKLVLKAEERTDLPPEVIEALVTYMMAEGHREEKGLWERLQEVFDNVDMASPDAEELQESFKTFFYREWDANLSDYKMDWCLVRQRLAKDDPNPFVEDARSRLRGLVSLIRRQFARLKPENFRKLRAQEFGDELDLEALIPAYVEMYSGTSLSDAIYIRRDKRTRDVAVLFLVDMSGSTEEKVNGRRVIDIQKEAMALMAEALDSLGDPFAVYGFSSDGRFRVDLFTVKDFGEPYGLRAQYRLGSLEPKDLTRMGAVIRHGVYKLDGVDALIKLMVILTDGRPYDLEYGSLSYAIADTKRAIEEARQHRIHPFVITSDRRGSEYMKRICPRTQSIVVPRVEHLPLVLPAMYRRLTT